MNNQKEIDLRHITNSQLVDNRSDELYKPIRDLSLKISIKKYDDNSKNFN